MTVAQPNPRKAEALNAIRKGRMTVPTAAKFAGVTERAMLAWCKLHKVDPARKVKGGKMKLSPMSLFSTPREGRFAKPAVTKTVAVANRIRRVP